MVDQAKGNQDRAWQLEKSYTELPKWLLTIFKSCIDEFAYCKSIVKVDGTWLYGKIMDACFFFLKNLRRHIIPYARLCLIFDRHESIKSYAMTHANFFLLLQPIMHGESKGCKLD
ncbi:hypothetical protein CR513_12184, partial [Mucuna pruriens]